MKNVPVRLVIFGIQVCVLATVGLHYSCLISSALVGCVLSLCAKVMGAT